MTVWFSSDQHFGHRNIIEYCKRPFPTVEQMDAVLIGNHNMVVEPDDTFVCVGDLSLSWQSAEWASEHLNGKKILIPGNHDKCWPNHTKAKSLRAAERARERYEVMGWEVYPAITDMVGPDGQLYVVSHLPYEEDERHGSKYQGYHPISNGYPAEFTVERRNG